MTAPIDWDSSLWGVLGHNVHHGTTDDLGNGGRHCEDAEDDR